MNDFASKPAKLSATHASPATERAGTPPAALPGVAIGLLAAMAVLDLILCFRADFAVPGLLPAIAVVALLGTVGLFYSRVRNAPPLSELASYAAMWLAFIATGGILSCLAAMSPAPFADETLAALDGMLGFDWRLWMGTIRQYPTFGRILDFSYNSLLLQIFGSIAFFAFAGISGRNEEMLFTSMAALLLCDAVFALVPAVGPWVHFDAPDGNPLKMLYHGQLVALKEGALRTLPLNEMEGIVCFPSFHTALACIFIYVHRGIAWTSTLAIALNLLMLASVPSEGGHYLCDMVAGVAAALLAIAASRTLLSPAAPAGSAKAAAAIAA